MTGQPVAGSLLSKKPLAFAAPLADDAVSGDAYELRLMVRERGDQFVVVLFDVQHRTQNRSKLRSGLSGVAVRHGYSTS